MAPWKESVYAFGLLFTSVGNVRAECSDPDSTKPCGNESINLALSVSSGADSVHWNQKSIGAADSASKDDISNYTPLGEKQTYLRSDLAPIYGTDSEGRARMYACDPYSGCR